MNKAREVSFLDASHCIQYRDFASIGGDMLACLHFLKSEDFILKGLSELKRLGVSFSA